MAADKNMRDIVGPPVVIGDPDSESWDIETDVLVVGFGGAGAATAIEASDQGCKVVIVDRFQGGGATAYSGGIHYAGATSVQAEAGVVDSAEEMYKYLSLEAGDAVSDATLMKYCKESSKNIEWLKSLGVEFGGDPYLGKTVYPPDGNFLYYSGNESLPAYAAKARPAVRGHRVVGKGYTGHIYFSALREAVEKREITVKRHTRVTRLLRDPAGRVIGAEALEIPERYHKDHSKLYAKAGPMPFSYGKAEKAIEQAREIETVHGKRIKIRAQRGVVLTTGGFCFNTDMLKQYMPKYAEFAPAMLRMGSMGCDGSGIQLGQSVGGRGHKLENNFYGRIIAPPSTFVEGIVVNRAGRRFYNEDAYNAELGGAIAEQSEGVAWLILDAATWKRLKRELLPKRNGQYLQWYLPALANLLLGGSRKGSTLEKLAEKCGIDAKGLAEEVRTIRDSIESRGGDPLGKSDNYYRAVGEGPYHAVNLSVWNKFVLAPFLTLGGLVVDESSGNVVDFEGRSIDGLYAAGRAAIGVCANRYLSGMSLSDSVFAGRRAARHIAGLTFANSTTNSTAHDDAIG